MIKIFLFYKEKWSTGSHYKHSGKRRTQSLNGIIKHSFLNIICNWLPAIGILLNILIHVNNDLGGKYLVFVSSCSVKMRGFSFLSLYKSVFIFQFLNVKMYNCGKQNISLNFIIKNLKKNQFPQKV